MPYERSLEQIFIDLTTGDDEIIKDTVSPEDADDQNTEDGLDAAYENAVYESLEEQGDEQQNGNKKEGPAS